MAPVRRLKTKRLTRGYDQVRSDIESPRHLEQYKETKDLEDLPGLGKHYCVECSKWFESEHNMIAHRKGKNHKRRSVICFYAPNAVSRICADLSTIDRVKILREEPHTQKLSDAAVGLRHDNGQRSQETVVDMEE
ncbi:putative C2H2 finger domain protein [Aspergillus melleus]|uniref:putative C2H2 finger domain protein n=1 Tax=Aspergillus melleus TaxID=138277 RepID=UPI001E8E8320|nr:uncharacterized protein LDX57_012978 [Aspergillus melleus]KAH8435349.1 hypothetical protein LDX57_012978 [Aspergillus melleus]